MRIHYTVSSLGRTRMDQLILETWNSVKKDVLCTVAFKQSVHYCLKQKEETAKRSN